MKHSDLELRLLARLRAKGQSASAVGIDLGTTKTSIACAHFDAEAGTLRCECLRFAQADGTARVAVPSVVAAVLREMPVRGPLCAVGSRVP